MDAVPAIGWVLLVVVVVGLVSIECLREREP